MWPGAVCGARGGDWTCCYVGWGVKNAPFVPVPPPPVTAEFDQSQVGRGGGWMDRLRTTDEVNGMSHAVS